MQVAKEWVFPRTPLEDRGHSVTLRVSSLGGTLSWRISCNASSVVTVLPLARVRSSARVLANATSSSSLGWLCFGILMSSCVTDILPAFSQASVNSESVACNPTYTVRKTAESFEISGTNGQSKLRGTPGVTTRRKAHASRNRTKPRDLCTYETIGLG